MEAASGFEPRMTDLQIQKWPFSVVRLALRRRPSGPVMSAYLPAAILTKEGPTAREWNESSELFSFPPFANIPWAQLVRTNLSRSAAAAGHNMLKSDGFHPDTVSITMAKE